MYDAVRPLIPNIPKSAPIVAGYIDGIEPWTDADFASFPNSVHIGIAVNADTNNGHVLDVERFDATPEQAPGWIDMRIKSGLPRATIYCNWSNWDNVKAVVGSRPVDYWLAYWSGKPTVIEGSIGTQWQSTDQFDISTMLPTWWPLVKIEENVQNLILMRDTANLVWWLWNTATDKFSNVTGEPQTVAALQNAKVTFWEFNGADALAKSFGAV